MAQAKLIDDVNVALRNQRARERTNGRLSEVRHIPDTSSGDTVVPIALWERLKRYLPQAETLTVAGRVIEKGFVVTPQMGISLMVAIAGMMLTVVLALGGVIGALYSRTSDTIKTQGETISKQNELLIRLDQRLQDKDLIDKEHQRKSKEDVELLTLKLQDLKDKFLVMNAKRGN